MERIGVKYLPQACLLCGDEASDLGMCSDCTDALPWLSSDQRWVHLPLSHRCAAPAVSVLSLWSYVWPVIAIQHRCKFSRWWVGGQLLACMAARRILREQYFDHAGMDVVPSPMFWTRRIARGGNHAAIEGRAFAHTMGLACAPHWLRRNQSRPQQMHLPRTKRLKNLRRSMSASQLVAGKRLIVFDDIVTTGATIRSMTEALYAKGAREVVGVCLMRVL